MIPGIDALGLGSPCFKPFKMPDNYALGLFDGGKGSWLNNFGDPLPAVIKMLDTNVIAAVRVHLWWDQPTVQGNPSQHRFPSLAFVRRALPRWEALAQRYPHTRFYISPGCEYNSSTTPAQLSSAVASIKSIAPSCVPVLNPLKGARTLPGVITEIHGDKAKVKPGQIISTDGNALFDANAVKWNKDNTRATLKFAWANLCNGAEAHNKLTPNKRTSFPDQTYIQGLLRILLDPGIAPKPGFGGKITPVKKPNLYKSVAEDLAGKNLRDNKPLLIAPGVISTITFITFEGQSIGKFIIFEKPGSYPGKLTRWYSGMPRGLNLMGWQIAEKAKALSGSEWTWVKVGTTIYGPIHPAFRVGFFQS